MPVDAPITVDIRSSTWNTPGDGVTTIFGVPVAPDVAMSRVYSGTRSGSGGSDEHAVEAARSSGVTVPGPASSHSDTIRPGAATSSKRLRSHTGRSHRSGRTEAPSFQAPNVANRCSGEFRSATTVISGRLCSGDPGVRPRLRAASAISGRLCSGDPGVRPRLRAASAISGRLCSGDPGVRPRLRAASAISGRLCSGDPAGCGCRSARSAATWFARRSSSAHVITRSVPSAAANTTATPSARSSTQRGETTAVRELFRHGTSLA